jgi:hypothetical protein
MTDKSDAVIPSILQPISTDEYVAPPRTEAQRMAVALAKAANPDAARRLGLDVREYTPSQRGTAAGLLAVNAATGQRYFELAPEAGLDDAVAKHAFASDGPVIDVQTHWVANQTGYAKFQSSVLKLYAALAPNWWKGLEDVAAYSMAEYLRCVFVEAETAVAVISAAPGDESGGMFISNDEMAGMRDLFDRTAGTGRLLNHTVVMPGMGEIERMQEWASLYRPVGWKSTRWA